MLASHASETMASLTITAHTLYALIVNLKAPTYMKLPLHQSYFTCGFMLTCNTMTLMKTCQQHTFAPSRLTAHWLNALLHTGWDWTESERDCRTASISILTITLMSISCTLPEHYRMPLCFSIIADWARKWDTRFTDMPFVFAEQVNAICLDRPPHRFI